MGIFLLMCFSASVFSIEGLGQERGLFKEPFLGTINYGRIEFLLKPEFTFINSNSQVRGLYWTNPFCLSMKIPVYRGLIFSFGNLERFDQSFDIYAEKDMLSIHATGRGGIEEIYLQMNQQFNFAEIFFRGSYLYGSAREIWEYQIGNYSIADTFLYKNKGRVFCAGLRLFLFSCYYEGLGILATEKPSSDTTYELPRVLGFSIAQTTRDWDLGVFIEYLNTENNDKTVRFKISANKRNLGFNYSYSPWYLAGIREYSFAVFVRIPLGKYARISFSPDMHLRTKDSLREFAFAPVMQLTLEEIFARRKK